VELEFYSKVILFVWWGTFCIPKIKLKPWPEPTAWAFQNLRPGQSCGQAITWAWLGLAHSLKLSHAHHYFQSQPIV